MEEYWIDGCILDRQMYIGQMDKYYIDRGITKQVKIVSNIAIAKLKKIYKLTDIPKIILHFGGTNNIFGNCISASPAEKLKPSKTNIYLSEQTIYMINQFILSTQSLLYDLTLNRYILSI